MLYLYYNVVLILTPFCIPCVYKWQEMILIHNYPLPFLGKSGCTHCFYNGELWKSLIGLILFSLLSTVTEKNRTVRKSQSPHSTNKLTLKRWALLWLTLHYCSYQFSQLCKKHDLTLWVPCPLFLSTTAFWHTFA